MLLGNCVLKHGIFVGLLIPLLSCNPIGFFKSIKFEENSKFIKYRKLNKILCEKKGLQCLKMPGYNTILHKYILSTPPGEVRRGYTKSYQVHDDHFRLQMIRKNNFLIESNHKITQKKPPSKMIGLWKQEKKSYTIFRSVGFLQNILRDFSMFQKIKRTIYWPNLPPDTLR